MVQAVILQHSDASLPHRQFRVEDIPLQPPGDGEVEVRHTAILCTSLDLTFCFPPAAPSTALAATHAAHLDRSSYSSIIPGFSAAGVITELGSRVLTHHIGQRVAYCDFPMQAASENEAMEHNENDPTISVQERRSYSPLVSASSLPIGAYCEARCLPVDRLVLVPEHLDDKDAAALLFPGLVARMLVQGSVLHSREQPVVVVHPAAGFLGSLVCQWAAHAGAFVIRTSVSQADLPGTRDTSRHPTVYCDVPDFPENVRSVLSGKRISIVFDLLGNDVVQGLSDCLEPADGQYVMLARDNTENYHQIHDNKHKTLGDKRFRIRYYNHYAASLRNLQENASTVFALISNGQLQCPPIQEYQLKLASQAFDEIHTQDVNEDSFCILKPPIPNPDTIPDLS